MVTAGSPDVPAPLVDQLRDGGRMVIPVGGKEEQVLRVIERRGSRVLVQDDRACVFVKLVGTHGWGESKS